MISGSLRFFLGPYHAISAEYYERNTEYLSHVEWERGFEGFLNLLCVFDEETESEDIRQAEAEIPTCADFLGHLLVEYPHDAEE